MKGKFHLLVRSRDGVVFRGDVNSITSFNEGGQFDVLERHANFISLIEKSLIIRDLTGKMRKIGVSSALMRVRDNFVEIYLGVEGIMTTQMKESQHIRESQAASGK